MGACHSRSAVPVPDAESLKGATNSKAISRRTTDDENTDSDKDVASPTAADKTVDGANECARETSDAVGLKEMKQEIKAHGPLNETVVRIETPIGIPIEEVYDGVHDGKVLGSGVEGIVRLVKHKATGVEYASKTIDIGLIKDEESLSKLRNEISIMCQVDHPNIVRLEEVYESETEIYLVQELCLGGDLFDRLDAMPEYHYSENQCARLVKQMLSSLLYLHSKKIIHRDLKLENFLFSSRNSDSELKLVDFGLSKHFQFGEVQHEQVGSPYTVAPEVIKGSYDERSDLWSIGVITYLLLSGETPFGGVDGEDLVSVRHKILRGSYSFEPDEYWENTSELSKDFIRKLLVVDYHVRPSAKNSLRHGWIERVNGYDSDNGSMHGTGINPNVVKALVKFKEYDVMHKLLLEILSFTLLPEQIIGLRGDFEKLDVDGDGEISLAELKQMLVKNAEAGSLGSLTEKEVEQIFDAMRVRKSETTIRWHEFIAAGISQCKIDERNLRLAFNRLDHDRKGSITFDNIMEMIGSNGNRDELQELWKESVRNECRSDVEQIQYDDFVLLMKGQTQDDVTQSQAVSSSSAYEHLTVVDQNDTAEVTADSSAKLLPSADTSNVETVAGKPFTSTRTRSMVHMNSNPLVSEDEDEDYPKPLLFQADSLRSLLHPGRRESIRKVDRVIRDETMSPLAVGKTVYRVNREMRLSILEAVKRFEEKQAQHASKGASLVMRRGPNVPTEEELVATAKKRSGRSQHRYRSASDLTGMFAIIPDQ